MADLSSITLPNDSTYNLKDATARSSIVYYGVCDTAADTQVKEVTISGITELFTGLHVRIYFHYAQGYDGQPKLKINNLSAKNIKGLGATSVAVNEWYTNTVVDMVYTGSVFTVVRGSHASTNYYGVTKLSSAVDSTATDLAATPSAVKTAYDLADTKQRKEYIRDILAPTSGWTGNDPYSFPLSTSNTFYTTTLYTKADISAPSESITKMISDGIKAMYIENTNGSLSLISVGAIPSTPIELQLSLYDVAPIPIITAQASQSHYNVGDTIVLSVTPTSEDYTYQWQYSTNNGSTWTNNTATGYNSDTFSWVCTANQNGRWYRCRVTNSVGSAVSNVVITLVG